jgi:hypothetical protein
VTISLLVGVARTYFFPSLALPQGKSIECAVGGDYQRFDLVHDDVIDIFAFARILFVNTPPTFSR